jgi:hypothetical protein
MFAVFRLALSLAREDGELLGNFRGMMFSKLLVEINRFHQLSPIDGKE